MESMKSKKFLSLVLALVMSLTVTVPVMAAEETSTEVAPYTVPADMEGTLVILHTNDVHGAVDGYAKVAALKEQFKAAGAEVLLVDAGDFIQGDPNVSVSQGESAVELMNLAGYDVAVPGNHEFDYGYTNLKALEEKAQFPILAANVKYEDKATFGTDLILTVGERKIGFFGLDTPETATKAHPAKIQGVSFVGGEELYKLAQTEVDGLKAEQVDVIVCLAHLGIDAESAINGNRSIDLLNNVKGIDLLIDGHSHSTLAALAAAEGVADGKVGDTVITSTGTKLANVGVVIIDKDGVITAENVPADAITVPADSAVAAKAAEIAAAVDAEYGVVFAKSEVDLNGEKAPGNRTEETNMGDLITDAMLWLATKEELDVPTENVIALTNGGGIRAAIKAGDVTKKDVNTVLPFGNTVAVDYVTGDVLLEVLEASTFCTPTAVGGFPQVAGIQFTVDTAAPFDAGENYEGTTYAKPNSINRVTIDSVNGKDFDPEATYAVVTNDFVAGGGDTYYMLKTSDRITDTGIPLDEALMQYITDVLGGVIPAEKYAETAGRIVEKYVGVEPGQWYTQAAKDVMDKGLMTSTGTGFEPNAVVTRATVVQTLWNLSGKPEQDNRMATFPDAQGTWYEQAVRWGEQMGIVEGTGAGFNGDRAITRAELVTMLYRYVQAQGNGFTGSWMFLLDFDDAAEVPGWADEAMHWCVMNKVVSGKSGNRLAPGDTAIRAELAQILNNYAAIPAAQ